MPNPVAICTPKLLPPHLQVQAAKIACTCNPLNAPLHGVQAAMAALFPLQAATPPSPAHLAVLVSRYWGTGGVHLTVGFMEAIDTTLAERILSHMNAWGSYCNVKFTLQSSPSNSQVRISLGSGGYWSYLGTDILSIPSNQQTMNLEGFTMDTPESEFHRVVRHETGHTLGYPHEHLRRELVALLDPQKTIAYFGATQGWDANTVTQQVLTPVEESQLLGTPHADASSIMCYQIPGDCTISGLPIVGGTDIDPSDQSFASSIYPLVVVPPPPPPPPPPPTGNLRDQLNTLFAQIESHLSGATLRLVKRLQQQLNAILISQGMTTTIQPTTQSALSISQIATLTDYAFGLLEVVLSGRPDLLSKVQQLQKLVDLVIGIA